MLGLSYLKFSSLGKSGWFLGFAGSKWSSCFLWAFLKKSVACPWLAKTWVSVGRCCYSCRAEHPGQRAPPRGAGSRLGCSRPWVPCSQPAAARGSLCFGSTGRTAAAGRRPTEWTSVGEDALGLGKPAGAAAVSRSFLPSCLGGPSFGD